MEVAVHSFCFVAYEVQLALWCVVRGGNSNNVFIYSFFLYYDFIMDSQITMFCFVKSVNNSLVKTGYYDRIDMYNNRQ